MDAMDDSVVIALFRHGLTEANERHAYVGWTDSPLCQNEERRLCSQDLHYDQFFSSDLPRCIRTLALLFPEERPMLLKEFREMNFGDWEGKVYEDLKELDQYRKWISNPLGSNPPDGESFPEFSERIQAGWSKIVDQVLSKGYTRIAIMTHGGVIRYLLSEFAPIKKEFWEWEVRHGSGYELVFKKEKLRRGEGCTLLQAVPLMVKKHG